MKKNTLILVVALTLSQIVNGYTLCHRDYDIKKIKDLRFRTLGLNYRYEITLKPGDSCTYNFDWTPATASMLYLPKT